MVNKMKRKTKSKKKTKSGEIENEMKSTIIVRMAGKRKEIKRK